MLTLADRIAISAPPGTSGLLALDIAAMTGTTRSSEGLDERRKRLLYRCWHRGTREMDLILGGFADAHVAALTDQEMAELEGVLDVPDPDLYAALISDAPLASGNSPLLSRIKEFSARGRA